MFAVGGDDPRLDQMARGLYRAARVGSGLPQAYFELENRSGRFAMVQDGVDLCTSDDLPTFFSQVEWSLTEAAMAGLGHYLQIHAAATVSAGAAILMVGPPDSGKTSLVIGFARLGARPLTDEIALIDPATLCVHAFPRDFIVHQGTQSEFPEAGASSLPFARFEGYSFVPPGDLSTLPTPAPTEAATLLFPDFQRGCEPRCSPLGEAAAAERILEQSFNLELWEQEGPDLIGALVERCQSFEIVFGDAVEAARLVLSKIE